MPIVTMSWLKETTPPRIRLGTISAMYIGATNEAVPTPRPSTNRARTSDQTSCASAAQIAPPTKAMPATIVVLRRLIWSAR